MSAYETIDAARFPGLAAYSRLVGGRRRQSSSRSLRDVYVDAEVLDAQPWFPATTLYAEVWRLKEGITAYGFSSRRLPRAHGDGRRQALHIIDTADQVAHTDRFEFSREEYRAFELARAPAPAPAPAAPAPAPAPAAPAPPPPTATPRRPYKPLAELTDRQWIKNRLGDKLLALLRELGEKEDVEPGLVAAIASRYLFRSSGDRKLWARGDAVLEAASGRTDHKWTQEESLALKTSLGLSGRRYHELRMLEEHITGAPSLKAPESSISDSFREQFLPGKVLDMRAAFAGRKVGPQPPPRFHGVRFLVMPAVRCIVRATLERHVRAFLVARGLVRIELGDSEKAVDAKIKTALEGFAGSGPVALEALIKKGADGMGNDKETRAQTKNILRGDFALLALVIRRAQTRRRGGQCTECSSWSFSCAACGRTPLFRQSKPNSRLACHPIVMTNANENSSYELGLALAEVEIEWEALARHSLTIALHGVTFIISMNIKSTMYDEKIERKMTGAKGATTTQGCAYCIGTTADWRDPQLLGRLTRRTPERWHAAAVHQVEGMRSAIRILNAPPDQRIMDSLHCDINASATWFLKIFVHEIARVYKWNARDHSDQEKRSMTRAEARLNDYLRDRLRMYRPMMMAGNFARDLMDEKTYTALLTLIGDTTRRDAVGRLLGHWTAMRKVWRPATDPSPADMAAYVTRRTALHGMIVDQNGPFGGYIAIPPYVHMAIEHVQTDWKDAVGPWSTEGLEASNRAWRYALEHLAANDLNGFEHALKVMWLRTHPTLAELVDREPRSQVCSVCATRGHNRRTCEERSLVGANGGEAGD